MAENVMELTGENWEREVVFSDKPVLVDFYGPNCGPCVKLAAVVEKLAQQYAGRVKMAKVNIDKNADLAVEYNVNSIPKVLIFNKAKKPLHSIPGFASERDLGKLLDGVLGQ